jgi:hypothetical protein
MITLTPAQLHILCHALGRDDYGRLTGKTEYRNHYDAGDDATLDVHALVLARLLEPYLCSGGWTMYRVTDEGRRQVLKQAPPAPAKTAAARRYRKWLDTADAHGLTFGQWLRQGYHHNTEEP